MSIESIASILERLATPQQLTDEDKAAAERAIALDRERERQQHRTEQLEYRLRRARMPEVHATARLSDWPTSTTQQARVLRIATKFAERFPYIRAGGLSLSLCGGVGTGKSRLACSVLRHVIEHGAGGRYTTAAGIFREVKEVWRNNSDASETQVLHAYTSPDLLVVDEIGVGHNSPTDASLLTEIIGARYDAERPTIVATNLSPIELERHLGPRVADRLAERGAVLVFDWPSFRRKPREAAP